MSFTVTEALVQAFSASVHHLLQQKKARLIDSVRTVYGVVGESYRFERLGSGEMQPRTRHGDTKYTNREHSTRLAVLKPFEDAELIDKEDKARTLLNLQNEYAASIVASYNRRVDRTIYEECLSPTANSDGLTGTAGAGLTFDLVNQAREYADEMEWPEEDRYFGVTGKALTNLLSDSKLTSADYNVVKALVSGTIPPDTMWMGFKWRRFNAKHVTRTYSGSDVDTEVLYAWHKGAAGLAFSAQEGELDNVRVDQLPTKGYAIQVYGSCMLGGQVIEDEGVLPITVDYV